MPYPQMDINEARKLAQDARGQGQAGQAAIAHGLCAIASAIMALAQEMGRGKKDAA